MAAQVISIFTAKQKKPVRPNSIRDVEPLSVDRRLRTVYDRLVTNSLSNLTFGLLVLGFVTGLTLIASILGYVPGWEVERLADLWLTAFHSSLLGLIVAAYAFFGRAIWQQRWSRRRLRPVLATVRAVNAFNVQLTQMKIKDVNNEIDPQAPTPLDMQMRRDDLQLQQTEGAALLAALGYRN